MRSLEERLLSKVSVNTETLCWEWRASKCLNGYGRIMVGGKSRIAHRISYQLHCGSIPDSLHVCHRCDNRACVNPEHLFLGTHADNMADRDAKGRQARGSGAGMAKLTEAEVVAILAAKDIPQRKLAPQYGISGSQVHSIRSGKCWAHVGRGA